MGKPHPPALARSLVAAARKGADVAMLAEEAREIEDPYHAAWALFQLAADDARLHRDALRLLARVPQDWRRAELATDVARHVKDNPETLDALMAAVTALPAGKPRAAAVQELSKRLPPRHLLRHATTIARAAGGTEEAKALLRAWSRNPQGDVEPVLAAAEATTRAHLLGYLHLQSARGGTALVADAFPRAIQAAKQSPERAEALRYLAEAAHDESELEALREAAGQGEDRVRVLARLVARADRLGMSSAAHRYLAEARTTTGTIEDEKTRSRIEANLDKAAERLHAATDTTPPPSAQGPRTDTTPSLPAAGRLRPILALHNGYAGGLATPHIRAVARAAPLCAAYGLDLMLIGFPVDDLTALVNKVEADTRVGEGGEYARLLLSAARLWNIPRGDHARPEAWGIDRSIIATTPRPDPAKVSLTGVGAAPVLVMGLGPEGLPPQLLARIPHHLELTGHGISLETATAMGIIAERLRLAG